MKKKKTYWNCAKLVTIVSCSNPVVVTLSVVYFDFGEDEEKKRINKKGGLYTRTVRKKIVALWMDSTHTHTHTHLNCPVPCTMLLNANCMNGVLVIEHWIELGKKNKQLPIFTWNSIIWRMWNSNIRLYSSIFSIDLEWSHFYHEIELPKRSWCHAYYALCSYHISQSQWIVLFTFFFISA